MRVRVCFHGCMEVEVDDKYKILDTEEFYNEDQLQRCFELEREVKKIVKNKINGLDIDLYDFNYCESENWNTIWDY